MRIRVDTVYIVWILKRDVEDGRKSVSAEREELFRMWRVCRDVDKWVFKLLV